MRLAALERLPAWRLMELGNRAIIFNTGSLVGTTVVTSVLGFAYWWLASRAFSPAAVGLAAAAVSAMTLLGGFSMLGLGTVLIRELPKRRGEESTLIATSVAAVLAAGTALGLLGGLLLPLFNSDLSGIAAPTLQVLFDLSVPLTAAGLLLDQAMVGLLRGEIQLARNTVFAVAKLALLAAAAMAGLHPTGTTIFATWFGGLALSLLGFALLAWRAGHLTKGTRLRWSLFEGLHGVVAGHYVLNFALQAPALLLPVLVTIILSAEMNAYFYAAWMIVGFLQVLPVALGTNLYAIGTRETGALVKRMRFTLSLAFAVAGAGVAVLFWGADLALRLFGDAYAHQASEAMRLLALGVLPGILRSHYVAVSRIQGRLTSASILLTVSAVLQLAAAGYGASVGGLTGLSIGWLAAVLVEAVFLLPTIVRAVSPPRTPTPLAPQPEPDPTPANAPNDTTPAGRL